VREKMVEMMMMPMYFSNHWGFYLLWEKWMVMNAKQEIGACFAFFFLAVIFEGLKALRYFFEQKITDDVYFGFREIAFSKYYIISSLLYIPQVTLGYYVMLATMSYNYGVFFSIVLGLGTGNFLFGWRSVGKRIEGDGCC